MYYTWDQIIHIAHQQPQICLFVNVQEENEIIDEGEDFEVSPSRDEVIVHFLFRHAPVQRPSTQFSRHACHYPSNSHAVCFHVSVATLSQ